MAPGADKVISYDPPGAIGLVDHDAVLLVRFDEEDDATRPQDDTRALADLDITVTGTGLLTMPVVADGAVGRARSFVPANKTGLGARDLDPGTTLVTRDCSIQVILSWNAAGQLATLTPGNIVSRGMSGSAGERVCYGLQLDVSDAPSSTALMRWHWEDIAGVARLQTGAQVVIRPGAFTMLTATRRWVSPTSVLLRYYVGDILIGEVQSADGSIGGATTGAVQIGTRRIAGVDSNFYAGRLDEVMVLDRELCAEEIEATWLRITKYQPLGTQMFIELHDPGFPFSDDPASDQQLETRLIGQALGYSAAIIENLRANFLPQRAYGSVLEQWEEATRVGPAPILDIDTRRARVLARLRQRRGVSIPGIGDALVGLLGGASVDDLEFIAFSNTIVDEFATIDPLRWDVTPAASWVAAGGGARGIRAAGSFTFAADTTGAWRYMQLALSGGGKQAHAIAKLTVTTPQANLETGVFFAERGHGNFLLVGLRDVAGAFHIFTESFIGGVSQGAVDQATLAGNPAALWLHVFQQQTDGLWTAAWSVVAEAGPFTLSPSITHPTVAHWTGVYMRTAGGATAGVSQVDVDSFKVRDTFGTRPLNAYVFLDPALGFTPDIRGIQSTLEGIKHAYTHVAFITKRAMLYDDPATGTDRGPVGGY